MPLTPGMGLRDGRGYGPYGMGYYHAGGGRYWPYGPHGERLGPDYDFRPGPNGGFLPVKRWPLKRAPSERFVRPQLSDYVTMGADEAAVDMTEAEWRRELLATSREVRDWQKRWVIEDKKVRHLQIAATLAIPLAAYFWKMLLKRTGKEDWL